MLIEFSILKQQKLSTQKQNEKENFLTCQSTVYDDILTLSRDDIFDIFVLFTIFFNLMKNKVRDCKRHAISFFLNSNHT